ncbi:MAG: thioredoxin domain-containing protein, partial [Myxococcota bacterium]
MDPTLPGVTRVDEELEHELAQALHARAERYVPRTEHVGAGGAPRYTNRLIRESSPYLLQHAHNPVNWFPWGTEAFERAAAENKLVLLSVGYSTCHWCHVMERESFEDEEIAHYLNAHYICVKVDREERPDVDAVYMTTVQMMSGRGGWPMTVILTDEKKPVFGGTYFPPRDGDRGARTGFLTLLRELEQARVTQYDELMSQAEEIARQLKDAQVNDAPEDVPSAFAIRDTVVHYSLRFDPQWGGFGKAPKFPRSAILELLARYAHRMEDPAALHMVERTLEKMAWGGMYDQVGGGFHRYSTDDYWLVPHFEKMLYDNAQLAVSYVEGWQLTGREDFARIARDTCRYVLRDLTHPQGGFFSASDADSEDHEGRSEEGLFFTWTPDELEACLDEELLRTVTVRYAPNSRGNFEGRCVLHLRQPDEATARGLGVSLEEFRQSLER